MSEDKYVKSAFPVNMSAETLYGDSGMSLRDYVAIKVFTAKIVEADIVVRSNDGLVNAIAESSLKCADAFLAAREKSNA